jgi:hypothetical protein
MNGHSMRFRNALALFFLILLTSSTQKGFSQDSSGDEVDYQVIEEAPSQDLILAKLRADALYTGYNRGDGGLGPHVNARIGKFYLNGGFGIDLWREFIISPGPATITSEEGLSPSVNVQGIVGYALYQRTKPHEVSVPVETEYTGPNEPDVVHVIQTDSKADDRIHAEIGLQIGRTWYDLQNVTFQEGSQGTGEEGVTMFNYTFLRLGGSFHRTYNTKIKTDAYGIKSNKTRARIYTHFALPLRQEGDPLTLGEPGLQNVQPASLEEETQPRPFGFFLGYRADVLTPLHYGYGLDIGLFPGLKGSGYQNFFFRITGDIGFSTFLGG